MIYDIFAAKRTRQKKEQRLPLIIADIHEKDSLVLSQLKASGQINLRLNSLEIGDYLIGDIIIERKTISDFVCSIINKRLMQQLHQMKVYSRQFLILEGFREIAPENIRISPMAFKGLILSIIKNNGLPIIFTKDCADTADYLILLAKQSVKKYSEPTLHSRIPKTSQEQKRYILESFPNIGPKTAKRLLEKFKTIQSIIDAPEEELKEILKEKTKGFRDLIRS